MIDEPNIVSYTVKELLSEIRSKLDHLTGALDAKADRADVTAVQQRIDSVDNRLDKVEREQEHQARARAETTEEQRVRAPLRQNLWLIVLTVAVLVEGAIGWVMK